MTWNKLDRLRHQRENNREPEDTVIEIIQNKVPREKRLKKKKKEIDMMLISRPSTQATEGEDEKFPNLMETTYVYVQKVQQNQAQET